MQRSGRGSGHLLAVDSLLRRELHHTNLVLPPGTSRARSRYSSATPPMKIVSGEIMHNSIRYADHASDMLGDLSNCLKLLDEPGGHAIGNAIDLQGRARVITIDAHSHIGMRYSRYDQGALQLNTNLSLNAIRTVAAFLVLISHLRALFFVEIGASESQSIMVLTAYVFGSLGHPAVIVFFVLSGYWVGGAAIRLIGSGTFSWSGYGIARLTRLWLVLIPVIALTQMLDRLGTIANPTSSIYSGSAAYHTVVPVAGPLPTLGIVETLGNLFFVQSIHTATLGTNSPLWSLAYEFWYYALFPALLIAFSRKFGMRMRVLCLLASILGCALAGPNVLALFPAWILGAALAWRRDQIAGWLDRIKPLLLAGMRASSVVAVIVVSFAAVYFNGLYPGVELIVAIPSVAMVGLLVTDVSVGRSALRPLSWAADWSYTLYAIHVPILAILASFIVPAATSRWQVNALSIAAALAISVIVAVAAFGLSLVTERNTNRVRRAIAKAFGSVQKRELAGTHTSE
jgi:peptidoglycan/LPS O-acetylase OafA/YrhL